MSEPSRSSPERGSAAASPCPGKPQLVVGFPIERTSSLQVDEQPVHPTQYGASTKHPFAEALSSHASPSSTTPLPHVSGAAEQ